jgi:hypothetical protein
VRASQGADDAQNSGEVVKHGNFGQAAGKLNSLEAERALADWGDSDLARS